MSPLRQGVFLWETPHTEELPQPTQQRCRELLTHLLLATLNTTPTNIKEERNEREDVHPEEGAVERRCNATAGILLTGLSANATRRMEGCLFPSALPLPNPGTCVIAIISVDLESQS